MLVMHAYAASSADWFDGAPISQPHRCIVFPMYEIEYIANGMCVSSFRHSGSQASVRTIVEDVVRRYCADHARIIDLIAERVETRPPAARTGDDPDNESAEAVVRAMAARARRVE